MDDRLISGYTKKFFDSVAKLNSSVSYFTMCLTISRTKVESLLSFSFSYSEILSGVFDGLILIKLHKVLKYFSKGTSSMVRCKLTIRFLNALASSSIL